MKHEQPKTKLENKATMRVLGIFYLCYELNKIKLFLSVSYVNKKLEDSRAGQVTSKQKKTNRERGKNA